MNIQVYILFMLVIIKSVSSTSISYNLYNSDLITLNENVETNALILDLTQLESFSFSLCANKIFPQFVIKCNHVTGVTDLDIFGLSHANCDSLQNSCDTLQCTHTVGTPFEPLIDYYSESNNIESIVNWKCDTLQETVSTKYVELFVDTILVNKHRVNNSPDHNLQLYSDVRMTNIHFFLKVTDSTAIMFVLPLAINITEFVIFLVFYIRLFFCHDIIVSKNIAICIIVLFIGLNLFFACLYSSVTLSLKQYNRGLNFLIIVTFLMLYTITMFILYVIFSQVFRNMNPNEYPRMFANLFPRPIPVPDVAPIVPHNIPGDYNELVETQQAPGTVADKDNVVIQVNN
jgi:hypothetical protein